MNRTRHLNQSSDFKYINNKMINIWVVNLRVLFTTFLLVLLNMSIDSPESCITADRIEIEPEAPIFQP